jgi:hypothetical protein
VEQPILPRPCLGFSYTSLLISLASILPVAIWSFIVIPHDEAYVNNYQTENSYCMSAARMQNQRNKLVPQFSFLQLSSFYFDSLRIIVLKGVLLILLVSILHIKLSALSRIPHVLPFPHLSSSSSNVLNCSVLDRRISLEGLSSLKVTRLLCVWFLLVECHTHLVKSPFAR